MTDTLKKSTFGEEFLLKLQNAESKGLLFAVVEKTATVAYPHINLETYVNKLSDFASVAAYQDKLARIRIAYNARAVADIHQRLIGLTNFGEDNYKYKEKMIRKLNLLINNHPTLDDVIYIAIAAYVIRGYGDPIKFKQELCAHIKDNRPLNAHSKMLDINCQSDICSV